MYTRARTHAHALRAHAHACTRAHFRSCPGTLVKMHTSTESLLRCRHRCWKTCARSVQSIVVHSHFPGACGCRLSAVAQARIVLRALIVESLENPLRFIAGEFFFVGPRAHVPCAQCGNLVAPYCAIPRDYLSDTPLLRAMGFLVSQHGQLGAIPPPPFLSVSPPGEHPKWRCDTPPQKGYLSDTCAIPYENKANGCDTPLCDTISKRYCAIWGGISHWGR